MSSSFARNEDILALKTAASIEIQETTKCNGFKVKKKKNPSTYFETELKWMNIIIFLILHVIAVYSLITFPYFQKKWTFLFGRKIDLYLLFWCRIVLFKFLEYFVANMVGFGITAGAHRLWTHQAFKTKLPLKIFLLFCFYTSGQFSLYNWVRDHRVHHKYSETKADPHDSRRGFFFSHIGWMLMRKDPEVLRRGHEIDMSDILSDPIVAFGERYYGIFNFLCCYAIPIIVPVYFWNEDWYYSIITTLTRFVVSLNYTWSVNSFAHMWGSKPYNKTIAAVENKFVAYIAMGEGFHNYHHVFPYDYKCAELGIYSLNWTTCFIDMFAKIGLAYDLKQPSKELIKTVMEKRGDGN